MRRAVLAAFFGLGALGVYACATPPIDASLDTDNTDLPVRTPAADASTGLPAPVEPTPDEDAGADANADAGVDAASLVPSGSYTGMYTNNQMANGCNFMNAGTLTATFTTSGTDLTTTSTVTGLQIKDGDCNLVDMVGGSASSSPVTNTAGTFTGTWKENVQTYGGQLNLPFSATLSGKTLKGTWTCSGCTGGFTISQP